MNDRDCLQQGMRTMSNADLESYMLAAAALVGLPLPAECRPGVLANLEQMQQIAQAYLRFSLPPDIEPANTFDP